MKIFDLPDTSYNLFWQDMHKVPPQYILAGFILAIMITGLYFFDHNVVAQLAQQKEFNLRNPSAYHYDLFLTNHIVLWEELGMYVYCIRYRLYFCQSLN